MYFFFEHHFYWLHNIRFYGCRWILIYAKFLIDNPQNSSGDVAKLFDLQVYKAFFFKHEDDKTVWEG